MPKRIKNFLEQEIGESLEWKDIEKLTVKGVINIFKGIKPDKSILDEPDDLKLQKLKFLHKLKTKKL